MKFTDELLHALKSHDRLPGVLSELLPNLKRNGSEKSFLATVPWREDHKPSLSVYRGEGNGWFFKDLAQGDAGDVIALVERVAGLDFVAAVKWLADRLMVALPEPTWEEGNKPAYTKPTLAPVTERIDALRGLWEKCVLLADGTAGAEYLRGRGLWEAASDLGIRTFEPGTAFEGFGGAARLGLSTPAEWAAKGHGFLVYPTRVDRKFIVHRSRLLMSQAEAVRAGFRAAHWTPSTDGGLVLPGLWPTLPETIPAEIVFCEGETDCLAMRTLIPGCLAYGILGAARFNERTPEYEIIRKARPRIILAFQRDEASTKSAKRLTVLFRRCGLDCCAIVPAGGAKDFAELLTFYDGERTIEAIGCPLGDYSISRVFDAMHKHIDDFEAGKIKPIPTPWPTLNWCFDGKGVPPQTIGLVSAKTGVGKTWLSHQWALLAVGHNLAAGLPVLIVNSEMAKSVIGARLIALAAGDSRAASLSNSDVVREHTETYQAQLDRLPLEITPPDPRSVDDVIDLVKEKARTHKLIFVDHIGDLSFTGKGWEVLPAMTLKLRNIARNTGAVIVLVTHIKKSETGVDTLAYSKAIENAVDWHISLTGFEEPQRAEISTSFGKMEQELNRVLIVAKNRFGRSDIRIGLWFDEHTLAMVDHGRIVRILKKARS